MICNLPLARMTTLLSGLSRLVNEKLVHVGAGSILLEADEKGTLTVSANNGKMIVKRSVDATVGLAGSVVLPLDTLGRWIAVAADWIDGETEVYLCEKVVGKAGASVHALEIFIDQHPTTAMSSGIKHTARFWTLDPATFATFTLPEIETIMVVSQAILAAEVAHVTWAGSHADDGVGRLGGANLHIHPDDHSLSLIAADGFRMARTSLSNANATLKEDAFLLPLSSLDALAGLLWADETVVVVSMGTDAARARVYFWSDKTMVGINVMSIDYPDVELLLSKLRLPQVSLTIKREDLYAFVRRIARYAVTTVKGGTLSPTVTLYAGPAEDWTLTVSSKMTSYNALVAADGPVFSGSETIPCRDVDGSTEIMVRCNATYLAEALGSTEEEEIRMEFRSAREPISFRSLEDDRAWGSYVMPMAGA